MTPYEVVRPQIRERLTMAATRVALVHGPAGFGKTTAMLQLRNVAQRDGTATAWLSLDDADNDAARFLSLLSQAIDGLDRALSARQPGHVAPEVTDRIAALQTPFVLFLDDFETIHAPVVLDLVARVIESLPEQGRIVIGSRTVPDIGLGRLRARGCLIEGDASLLRFSALETGEFLSRRGLRLAETQVERLHRRTEGWITAIWLASLTLERCTDVDSVVDALSGSHEAVADYLTEAVLQPLSADLRDFMLKSSVLDELDEPVCNAIAERSDGGDMLKELRRRDLFLMPLDDNPLGHRYHRLFSGFLRAELDRRHPGLASRLHRAASQCYLSQDRAIPAIRHAFATGDVDYAIAILERHVDAFVGSGRLRLLARWLDAVPRQVLEQRPRLRTLHAWSVMLTRGPRAVSGLIEGLEASAPDAETRGHLLAMRPMLLGLMDRIDEARELGLDALPRLAACSGFAYGMLTQALTSISTIGGQRVEARRFADQGRRAGQGLADHFSGVLTESAEAAMEMMQGRLRLASARLHALRNPRIPGMERRRHGIVFTEILSALALYDAGDCECARQILETYAPLAMEIAHPDSLICAQVLLARIAAQQGHADQALRVLAELETAGGRLGLHRVVASARLERAHLLLLRGDADGAGDQLTGAGDAAFWAPISSRWFIANDTSTLALARFRLQIHSGSVAEAISGLKQALEVAEIGQRHRRALKLRILLAQALQRDGQQRLALRHLGSAVSFAASEGFVQTFLEEDAAVHGLLLEYLEGIGNGSELPGDWLNRVRAQRASSSTGRADAIQHDTLTRKELQVVALLAQGYSNAGMAQRLFVSDSTVRTHLRSINVKLRAEGRMQALVIARKLGLVQ